ncbi:MAG: hypothetical protein GXO77_05220 [Calditrichaeota bacterium]|nr:hypothetical protein [Calditrichota bacterium]
MNKKTIIPFLTFILMFLTLQCKDNGTGPEEKNVPGKILWVEVPDSIQIPEAGYFNKALIKAAVQDSNGLDDVDSVYFYSRKPDGTLANKGKPLTMVDNGKPFSISGDPWVDAGDEKAGDGIYSLTILIFNDAQAGRYYFTFYMRDKAGNLSDSIIDSIEVYR